MPNNSTTNRNPMLPCAVGCLIALAASVALPGPSAAGCSTGTTLWAYDHTNTRLVTLDVTVGQPIAVTHSLALPPGTQLEGLAWSPASISPATLYGLLADGNVAAISLSTGALSNVLCAACGNGESAFALATLDASGITQFVAPIHNSISNEATLINASTGTAMQTGILSGQTIGGLDVLNCSFDAFYGPQRDTGSVNLHEWNLFDPGNGNPPFWTGPTQRDTLSPHPAERIEGMAIDSLGEFFIATQNGRIYSFFPSVNPFPPPILPTDHGHVPGSFEIRGLAFGPTPPAPTPTPTPAPALDAYLGFQAKPAKVANNVLPKGWRIQLDDVSLAGVQPDDPENYEVSRLASVANPGQPDAAASPELPDLHYLRYKLKESRQGASAAVGGKFPKAVKHAKRRWELENALGTITVDSAKVASFLLPAGTAESGAATTPAQDRTHFKCYKVKPARNVISDQTPEVVLGSGKSKFQRKLQLFFRDSFDDCSTDSTFAGTSVAGSCLYDLRKPVELCNPVIKSAVGGGRETTAVIAGSTPAFTQSLLCYQARLSRKITSATLGGGFVGQSIAKLQSPHRPRRLKDGSPLATAPGNAFPAPIAVDTRKADLVCLPTDVLAVSPR